MTDNIDLTTLRQFNCYNVCIEMLKDRGIDTQKYDIIDIKTFLDNKDEYLSMSIMNNGKYIMVLFNKSCKKPTNEELSVIIGKNSNIGEILYFYIPSNFEYEKKQLIEQKLISDTIKITPYNMGVWCVNPTKHVLQPKYILHKKNSIGKYQEIIKQYEKSSLPKFCIDDPIVKYYAAMPDDIFEIRRIGQETLSYRIVSNKQINLFKNK